LLAPAAAIAVMLIPGIRRRTVAQVATALVIVAIGTFGYGAWRLAADPSDPSGGTDRRGVGEHRRRCQLVVYPGDPTVLANCTKQVTAAAESGAQVVLLPEQIIDVDATALVTLQAKLQAIATSNNIQLVAGSAVFGEGGNDHNRALVPHPDGVQAITSDWCRASVAAGGAC
jgi:apolipoprotein N-acyltransferase